MCQLLGRPSGFKSSFTKQLGKTYQVHFSLELLDACIDVGQFVIVLPIASDVGGNAPIVQLLGSIDKGVEDG